MTQLPTALSLGSVDVSFIADAIHSLALRLAQAESRAADLEKTVSVQQTVMESLIEKSETTQDQFSNLYDAVQIASTRLSALQETCYEKSKALTESVRVDNMFDRMQAQLAHLETTKVNADSEELSTHVQRLATDASSAALYKFEREQKNWVLEQTKLAEERWSKNVALKEIEQSQALELRFQYLMQKSEDVSHREQALRREVDNNLASATTILNAMCCKLETHERNLEISEQESGKRCEWLKERFDLFLELCLGTSWDDIAQRFPDSHPLLRSGSRKFLFVPFSEILTNEDVARNKRYQENVTEWRKLHGVSNRLLVGVGSVLRALESTDQQITALLSQQLENRRQSNVQKEDQLRHDAAANEGMLRRYLSETLGTVESDEMAPLSLQVMRFLGGAPFFTLLSRNVVSMSESTIEKSMKQFQADFSNQLVQFSKELRGKSSITGLEETVKNVAVREAQAQVSVLRAALDDILADHVGKTQIDDLLRMKADVSLTEQKADDGYVRFLEVELRAAIASESTKTHAAIQETTLQKLTDLSQNMVLRHDPRIKTLFSVAEELPAVVQLLKGQTAAVATTTSALGTKTCLTCQQSVGRRDEGLPTSATEASNPNVQQTLGQEQIGRPLSSSARKAQLTEMSGTPQLRMREWADDVQKKFNSKTPKPPTRH